MWDSPPPGLTEPASTHLAGGRKCPGQPASAIGPLHPPVHMDTALTAPRLAWLISPWHLPGVLQPALVQPAPSSSLCRLGLSPSFAQSDPHPGSSVNWPVLRPDPAPPVPPSGSQSANGCHDLARPGLCTPRPDPRQPGLVWTAPYLGSSAYVQGLQPGMGV